MKPGIESQTAILVCKGRAVAHGKKWLEDPTALVLLPPEARERVQRFLQGESPRGLKSGFEHGSMGSTARLMVPRTLAIDEAVRQAACPQLVILGAGLDGRAWRMADLQDTVVFEVDHPDSQRQKRLRSAPLQQAAREVRFVPVDFTKDSLDEALAAAGHDPTLPTTWIWEGVVMYLKREAIESTLSVIARRSSPGSRITIAYHGPSLMRLFVGLLVRRMGEPLRSSFSADEMRALLSKYGFSVVWDEDITTLGARLSSEIVLAARMLRHERMVTADHQSK